MSAEPKVAAKTAEAPKAPAAPVAEPKTVAKAPAKPEIPTVKAGDRVLYTFKTSGKNAKSAQENPRRTALVHHVEPDGELTLTVLLKDGDGLHGFVASQTDVPYDAKGGAHTWQLLPPKA